MGSSDPASSPVPFTVWWEDLVPERISLNIPFRVFFGLNIKCYPIFNVCWKVLVELVHKSYYLSWKNIRPLRFSETHEKAIPWPSTLFQVLVSKVFWIRDRASKRVCNEETEHCNMQMAGIQTQIPDMGPTTGKTDRLK